jgi:2-dehydropantoate 2-reductase
MAGLRHGVLGAGGVGGLLGACLARAGREVVLLMRPASLARYDGHVHVESALLGRFDVDVPAAPALDRELDVIWVTPKATQLEAALGLLPPEHLDRAVVVPLLNGIDHVELLRSWLGVERILPGTIYVESELVDVGRVLHKSAFVNLELAPHPRAAAVCAEVDAAGLGCGVGSTEPAVMWRKLATLAPIALTTTALRAPISAVVADPAWHRRLEGCLREVAAILAAEGGDFDADGILARYEQLGDLRSSMQKDREAGRPLELDAIGGAVLRAADRHGLQAPATRELVELIADAATVPAA